MPWHIFGARTSATIIMTSASKSYLTTVTLVDTIVSMMIADVLAPRWCQDIWKHHADVSQWTTFLKVLMSLSNFFPHGVCTHTHTHTQRHNLDCTILPVWQSPMERLRAPSSHRTTHCHCHLLAARQMLASPHCQQRRALGARLAPIANPPTAEGRVPVAELHPAACPNAAPYSPLMQHTNGINEDITATHKRSCTKLIFETQTAAVGLRFAVSPVSAA